MDQLMTPSATIISTISDEQIDKFTAQFKATLVQHRKELGFREVEKILNSPQDMRDQWSVVRKAANAFASHSFSVDRMCTPQQVIDATGRAQHVDPGVLEIMPRGAGKKAKIHFFVLDRDVTDDELEGEYAQRGLVPADAYTLCRFNELYPAFAIDYPNATHWKDVRQDVIGEWCYIAFNRFFGVYTVYVRYLFNVKVWFKGWFFAGLLQYPYDSSAESLPALSA